MNKDKKTDSFDFVFVIFQNINRGERNIRIILLLNQSKVSK